MFNKVRVMAISPKILTLRDAEIFSCFKDKDVSHLKSNEWISFNNINGINVKISKTGIAETKEFFEGKNIKERLIELVNITQKIAYDLFGTKAVYDVFIHQNQNINPDIIKKVSKNNEKIESIAFILKKNIYVEIKIKTFGYWIILKGITDVKDITTVFDAIVSEKSNSLMKMGCKDFKAVISVT